MSNLIVVDLDSFPLIFTSTTSENTEFRLNLEDIVGTNIKFLNDLYLKEKWGINLSTIFKLLGKTITNQVVLFVEEKELDLIKLVQSLNYYLDSFRIKLTPIYSFTKNESEIRKK